MAKNATANIFNNITGQPFTDPSLLAGSKNIPNPYGLFMSIRSSVSDNRPAGRPREDRTESSPTVDAQGYAINSRGERLYNPDGTSGAIRPGIGGVSPSTGVTRAEYSMLRDAIGRDRGE